jgi:hypothetical protein
MQIDLSCLVWETLQLLPGTWSLGIAGDYQQQIEVGNQPGFKPDSRVVKKIEARKFNPKALSHTGRK